MNFTDNFTFPLYLKDTINQEYYRYSDGNHVLQFNTSCIHNHCAPYIMQDKEEFISFLNVFFKRSSIVQITEEKFNEEFKNSLDHILNFGSNPQDYWTREIINNNNNFLKKST